MINNTRQAAFAYHLGREANTDTTPFSQ